MITFKTFLSEAKSKKSFDLIGHLKRLGFADVNRMGNTIYTKFPDHVKNELSNLHAKKIIPEMPNVSGIRSREPD